MPPEGRSDGGVMARMESRFFAVAAFLATVVGVRGAWAGPIVMGGYQILPNGELLTEIVTEFQVPNAPAHFSAPFSMWPALQSNSHIIQPVLRYTDQGCGEVSCPHWEMQNEVEPGGLFGRNVWVNPQDWILAYVYLDQNNPGANCNIFVGSSCNYLVGWEDLTNTSLSDVGLSQAGMTDFTFPDVPYIGWGLVLETGTGVPQTYNDCTDLPQSAIGAQTAMYQVTWGGLYTPVPTNLSLGYPGVGGSFTFTNQSLTDGGHVVGTGGLNCGWTCGVGIQSTNVGKIIMGF
jgi:hypothetical protein